MHDFAAFMDNVFDADTEVWTMVPGDGDPRSDGDEERPSLERLADEVRKRRGRAAGAGAAEREVSRSGGPSTPADESGADGSVRRIEDEAFGHDPKTEAILEVIGDASNVLLCGPLLSQPDYDLCSRLTSSFPRDADNLLLVSMTESPDERLSVLQGYTDDLPERTVVLNVGDTTRSGASETVSTGEGGTITIENVADPSDLMRIGITVSKRLSEWEVYGGTTAVCFHSLTALLQHAEDSNVAFRFVHTLLGRLKSTGARAHFHVDAGAHDQHVLATYRPIFDEVLTFEEDGTVRVES